MKRYTGALMLISSLALMSNSHAFPEIPFCPSGGPPGWMNHFINKHDRDRWQYYSPYLSPAYQPPVYYSPYPARTNYQPYKPRYANPYNRYPINYSAPTRRFDTTPRENTYSPTSYK